MSAVLWLAGSAVSAAVAFLAYCIGESRGWAAGETQGRRMGAGEGFRDGYRLGYMAGSAEAVRRLTPPVLTVPRAREEWMRQCN